MKKLTIMLLPVLPGFNSWAAQGFIEYAEKCDDATNRPEALSKDTLVRLSLGFIPQGSDLVCIPYDGVAPLVRSLTQHSLSTAFQPLDRGGILLSFGLTQAGSDLLDRMIGSSEPEESVDAEPAVSKSK